MRPSFRKQMIAGAIATLLSAPAWTASVTETQTGSEAGSNTGNSSSAGTSQTGTTYGSGSGTTSGSAGAGTTATSGSMDAGAARSDNPLYSRTGDDLVGSEIVGASGEDIGEINKIVLTQGRRDAHAVLAIGGFLGLGEHDIAVSLDELWPAGDDKWRLNATKEQLEARPEYRSEQYVEVEGDQPISESITDFFAAFETDQNNNTGISQSGTAHGSGSDTTSGSAGAGTLAADGSRSGSMGAASAMDSNPLYSRTGDDLVGSEIVGASGDDIGEIDKIVLSQDRRGAHAVVAIGGFLGLGEHDIAVSLDELQPVGDDKWQLNATKEQLESRPEYRSEQYVDLEGDQPISGSITDFSAFETDQNNSTGLSQSGTAYGSGSDTTSGTAGAGTLASDSDSTSGPLGTTGAGGTLADGNDSRSGSMDAGTAGAGTLADGSDSTSGSMDAGTAGAGTLADGSDSTSGSMDAGTAGTDTLADGSDSTSGSMDAGTAGAGKAAAGTSSTSGSMSARSGMADNPLYSRTGDDLVGSEIVGATGDDIGEIEKIVLTQDRRGAHAVVSIGGFLGVAEHDIVVSLDELQPAGDDKWQLNATKEQLEARPEYRSEQYVELENDQPISGSITDFAAFETDGNNSTGTSRDSNSRTTMENMLDENGQPLKESGAAGGNGSTSGSGTTGTSATQ